MRLFVWFCDSLNIQVLGSDGGGKAREGGELVLHFEGSMCVW